MPAKKKATKKPARKTAARRVVRIVKKLVSTALPPVGLPKLGEAFPGQGGVFAGLIRDDNGTVRALVVGTDKACNFEGQWGKYGQTVSGAESKSDGRANTAAMEAAGSPIAKQVRSINVDGHTDFYVPSRRELALIEANVAHLLDKDVHWSSTQYSSTYAWAQYFTYGLVNGWGKGLNTRVRAVRSLVIS